MTAARTCAPGRRRPLLAAPLALALVLGGGLCVVAPAPVRAAAAVDAPATADPATTALDRYLDGLKSWRARFTQVVVDGRKREVGRGSGLLLIDRPGKFRWELAPDTGSAGKKDNGAGASATQGQLLVADGRNLWFFDRELEQVTVKPVSAALAQTPAMLLSGTGRIRDGFTLSSDGRSNGLEWVRAVPRQAEADFRAARFGFAGTELRKLVLEDKLGQTATLTFEQAERNGRVDPAELTFTAPAGVDVIGTPTG